MKYQESTNRAGGQESYRPFIEQARYGIPSTEPSTIEGRIESVESEMFSLGTWSEEDGLSKIREDARYFLRLLTLNRDVFNEPDHRARFWVWLCEDPRHDEVYSRYISIDFPEHFSSRGFFFNEFDDWVRSNPDKAFRALNQYFSKTDWSKGSVAPWAF